MSDARILHTILGRENETIAMEILRLEDAFGRPIIPSADAKKHTPQNIYAELIGTPDEKVGTFMDTLGGSMVGRVAQRLLSRAFEGAGEELSRRQKQNWGVGYNGREQFAEAAYGHSATLLRLDQMGVRVGVYDVKPNDVVVGETQAAFYLPHAQRQEVRRVLTGTVIWAKAKPEELTLAA